MGFFELHKTHTFSFWVLRLQNILNFYKMLVISQGSLRQVDFLRNFHIMLWTKQSTLIYKLLCISLCRLWYFSQRSIRQVFFLLSVCCLLEDPSVLTRVFPNYCQYNLSYLALVGHKALVPAPEVRWISLKGRTTVHNFIEKEVSLRGRFTALHAFLQYTTCKAPILKRKAALSLEILAVCYIFLLKIFLFP